MKNVKFKIGDKNVEIKQGKLHDIHILGGLASNTILYLVHVASDKKIYVVNEKDVIEVTV